MKRILLILLAALLLPTAVAQGKVVDDSDAERIARKLFRAAGIRTIPCPADVIRVDETNVLEYTLICGVSVKTAEFEEFKLQWQEAVRKSWGKKWELLEDDKEWSHYENGSQFRIYQTGNAFVSVWFKYAFVVFRYGSNNQKLYLLDPEILDALGVEIIDSHEPEEP